MIFLIDYENVGSSGMEGIDALSKDDRVEIFFSEKNNRMSMDMVSLVRGSDCKIEFVKTEKTAPQYMDIQIICRACELLAAAEDMAGIVSEDNGYISAKDFHEKKGKTILLGKAIKDVMLLSKAVKPTKKGRTAKAAGADAAGADSDKAPQTIKKVSQTKKLSPEDKGKLKEMVKDLPKHNGMTTSCVLECFDKCKTLGEMQFELNSKLGRRDGTKAYQIVQEMFLEIKGLKLKE